MGYYPWGLGFESRDGIWSGKGEKFCSRWKLWWNPSELLSGELCVSDGAVCFLKLKWFYWVHATVKKRGSVFNLYSVVLTAVCVRRCWFALILLKARFMLVATKCIQFMYEHWASVCVCMHLFQGDFGMQFHVWKSNWWRVVIWGHLTLTEWHAEFIPSALTASAAVEWSEWRKITLINTFIKSAKCFSSFCSTSTDCDYASVCYSDVCIVPLGASTQIVGASTPTIWM